MSSGLYAKVTGSNPSRHPEIKWWARPSPVPKKLLVYDVTEGTHGLLTLNWIYTFSDLDWRALSVGSMTLGTLINLLGVCLRGCQRLHQLCRFPLSMWWLSGRWAVGTEDTADLVSTQWVCWLKGQAGNKNTAFRRHWELHERLIVASAQGLGKNLGITRLPVEEQHRFLPLSSASSLPSLNQGNYSHLKAKIPSQVWTEIPCSFNICILKPKSHRDTLRRWECLGGDSHRWD